MREHLNLRKDFEEAFDEYLEPIYRYFFYRLNDRERAKELAQETFMRAWSYAIQGKEIKAMKPFLYTTASNIFKNELRDRRQAVSLDMLVEDYGLEIKEDGAPGEETADARMLIAKLDQLSKSDQEVLTLRYVDGLGPKEIALMRNENESAVSVRIHRALKKLRAVYEGTP